MYASLFLCFLDILLLLREKGKDPTYIFYLCRLGSQMLQTTLFSQPFFSQGRCLSSLSLCFSFPHLLCSHVPDKAGLTKNGAAHEYRTAAP